MSNLGKVYVLNIRSRSREIYPVVYMNKQYLYCKVYGCNELRKYTTPEDPDLTGYRLTMHYDDFKHKYEAGEIIESHTYTVYVPSHIKTFFEWIKEKSPLEFEIEKVVETIRILDKRINSYKDSIAQHERIVTDTTAQKEEKLTYLEKLRSKLSNSQEV